MNYKLIEKTYKDERYVLPYNHNSSIVVRMHYHTTRHYWDVSVYFTYPPYYQTEIVDGKPHVESRKEAREIANKLMSVDPNIYWNKLSDFYKDNIMSG